MGIFDRFKNKEEDVGQQDPNQDSDPGDEQQNQGW